jgi:hypothetical protein
MTRRVSVETVRVGIELERGAVVDTEGQGFDDTRRHPVAACTTSSCSRESHLIQVGRVTIGRTNARATARNARPMLCAVTSSHESIASPGTRVTRSGSFARYHDTAPNDIDRCTRIPRTYTP